mmetsp:Transcript_56167/g.143088  ORF Transcript_56167/g.143088 Transcript_56167/m.143088 type:complete len:469 (-) Transcript_56167:53-1459(-)
MSTPEHQQTRSPKIPCRSFPALLLLVLVSRPVSANPLLGLHALRAAAAAAMKGSAAASDSKGAATATDATAKGDALAQESPIVIKLWASSVPVAGRLAAKLPLDADEAFYVGKVNVGAQDFSVLFDTAAGNLILPSAGCSNSTCLERRRYTPRASASARPVSLSKTPLAGAMAADTIDIEFDQIELGNGMVTGELWRDTVCLQAASGSGGSAMPCTDLGLVAATEVSEVPFRSMPHDGMLGLGLDGLVAASPLFSFMRRLSSTTGDRLQPQFTLAARGPWAELTFGGPGAAFSRASPPVWRDVARVEDGYWQVRIHSIRVGNITVDHCEQGCRGIIDTGAARLGVPAATVPKLSAAITATMGTTGSGAGCSGPDLQLDLGAGEALKLRAADYYGPSCNSPRLTPLNLGEGFEGVIVLGLSVLRRYDTIFDWGALRVGFALNAPRAVRLGSGALLGDEGGALTPSVTFV